MRISTAVAMFAAALVMVQPVYGQAKKAPAKGSAKPAAAPAAAPAPAASASLAGRWEGTFTTDVTQKSGKMVLNLNGADDGANGMLMLTPTGGKTVGPEGAMAPAAAPAKGKAAPAAPASGGLSVTAMKASDDKVSGSVDGAYMDPGCNCSVVSTFEGELNGNTLVGTISARDARTGQWNFTSFTVSKGGAAAKK
jgi:hypothetical protein